MSWCAIMISSSLATTWWIDTMYNKRKRYDLSSFKITTLSFKITTLNPEKTMYDMF
jgi:hypothetical protein